MLRNQMLLMKSALITVFILLTIFTCKAAFAGENLFWMPVVLLPLLILSFYQISNNRFPIIWKFFIGRRHVNAGWQDGKENSYASTSIKVRKNDLTVLIGNENDPRSYKASIFNIRVGNKAVKSLADQSFRSQPIYCDDANLYELIEGDRIFHVGPDYTGCRTKRGGFDAGKFKELACEPTVKIIELDLATPRSHFDNLVSAIGTSYVSVTSEKTALSTLGYTVFSDADGMVLFLERLYKLSGGKPVGIKLRMGNKKELYNICYAIRKARFNPQFMIIESAEQVGFRSPYNPSSNTMPLYEAILFASKTLEIYELDKKIKLIAAANILCGADLLKLISLGASAVWSEVSGYKIVKVNNYGTNEYLVYDRLELAEFHNTIITAATQIMKTNGVKSVNDITLSTFF